eukprot:1569766-Rhodomonas_salina.4
MQYEIFEHHGLSAQLHSHDALRFHQQLTNLDRLDLADSACCAHTLGQYRTSHTRRVGRW